MQRKVEALSSARKHTQEHATEKPGRTFCQQEFNAKPLVINLQLTLPRKYLASKRDRTSPANDTMCPYPAWHSTTAVVHTWHTCTTRLWDPSLAAYTPNTTLSNFVIFGTRTSTPRWRFALDDRRLFRLLALHVCGRSCRTCKELRVLTQERGCRKFHLWKVCSVLERWEQLRLSQFDFKKCERGKKVFTNFLWNAHTGLEVYIHNTSRIWCDLTAVQLKQSGRNRILRST
jgi:hypothetical protein